MFDEILNRLEAIRPAEDVEGFNAILKTISKMMGFPDNLRLAYVKIDDLREQDLNANSMPKKMFDQLVANIKGAGAPESIPLCATIEGEGEIQWIVSGHHRIKGTREAGQSYMLILLYEGLSWARVRSKQLAHNSIAGTSDPELVKRIWEQIDTVEARFEAFIDPRMFEAIPPTVSFQPVDVDFAGMSKTILVVFLSSQYEDMETALEAALPKGQVDAVYLAERATYDKAIEVLKQTRDVEDIKAVPTAMARVFELAMERLAQLNAESVQSLEN